MSGNTRREGYDVNLRGTEGTSWTPPEEERDAADLSSRKRKAGSLDTTALVNNPPLPLVPVTKEGLTEMRRRVATVAEETVRTSLVGRVGKGKGKSSVGGASATSTGSDQDTAATASYLRAFQAAIMTKVASACDMQDAQEQREANDLMEEILRFNDEMQCTRERLEATRARVAKLAATTCNDSLRIAKVTDDRIAAALNAKTAQARKDCDAGVPPAAVGGAGVNDDGLGAAGDSFAGLEQGALEPKVSLLIGKITELPGPLKSVLQEMPELTASLAKTVQSVEAAMSVEESRTESLLGKAPPTPIVKGNGGAAGGEDGGHLDSRFPEDVRATAREARAKQAREELEAGGAGVLGRIFS